MKICHIINSLNSGGAENVLLRLNSYEKNSNNEIYVISLINSGELTESFRLNTDKLIILNFKKNFSSLFEFFKLLKLVNKLKPDILVGWMYHSSLLAFFCYKYANVGKLFWNIRHTKLFFSKSSLFTIFICKIMAYISKFSSINIIYCSDQSANHHSYLGYNNINSNVIYNGVDTNKFKYSELKRNNFKKEKNIMNDIFLLGMIANYRPQKNHKLLFKILSKLKYNNINFKIILAGRDINSDNSKLMKHVLKYNLNENILLLDNINNIEDVLSSMDVLILTSEYGESFSNVLIEAMSSSVPCISSNVGASKFIIDKCGWIPEEYSEGNFFQCILKAYSLKQNQDDWETLRKENRERVVENFSLVRMLKRYNEVIK